ncbi:MAG: hypothetical protein OXP12_08605 [Thaumarchaeota archaeon]|nr:hypothetical protein [Nitrososphaerota archaeon]MDE0266584.1 hypothetical protein [Nitrososphaerota archaeon]MDE0526190.1 hypothetical protein [Nitrososphaerota archaeon]
MAKQIEVIEANSAKQLKSEVNEFCINIEQQRRTYTLHFPDARTCVVVYDPVMRSG